MLDRLYRELLADSHLRVRGGLSPKTVRYMHTIVHKAVRTRPASDGQVLALWR